jgi:NitT/TauT family transport system substrate-binding protein
MNLTRSRAILVGLTPLLLARMGSARADDLRPLRVAATANDTYAEAYYAQAAGFFTKAGLAVDLQTFTNGTEVVQAVAAGAADAGVSGPLQLAIAATHDVRFQMVAGANMYNSDAPTTALYAASNSTIREAKDLVGKTIGLITLRDSSLVGVSMWLEAAGVDPASVRIIEVPFSEMGPALGRGTIAAASIAEPAATVAQAEIRLLAKYYDAFGKRWLQSCWFTTPDIAKSNADGIRRFTSAIYATATWANAHHAETAAILATIAKVSPDITRTMTRATYATSLDPKLVQPPLDYAYKYKLLSRPVSAQELMA